MIAIKLRTYLLFLWFSHMLLCVNIFDEISNSGIDGAFTKYFFKDNNSVGTKYYVFKNGYSWQILINDNISYDIENIDISVSDCEHSYEYSARYKFIESLVWFEDNSHLDFGVWSLESQLYVVNCMYTQNGSADCFIQTVSSKTSTVVNSTHNYQERDAIPYANTVLYVPNSFFNKTLWRIHIWQAKWSDDLTIGLAFKAYALNDSQIPLTLEIPHFLDSLKSITSQKLFLNGILSFRHKNKAAAVLLYNDNGVAKYCVTYEEELSEECMNYIYKTYLNKCNIPKTLSPNIIITKATALSTKTTITTTKTTPKSVNTKLSTIKATTPRKTTTLTTRKLTTTMATTSFNSTSMMKSTALPTEEMDDKSLTIAVLVIVFIIIFFICIIALLAVILYFCVFQKTKRRRKSRGIKLETSTHKTKSIPQEDSND